MRTLRSLWRTKPATMLGIVLSAIPLASCVTMTASVVPTDRVACGSFRAISWSSHDTAKTVEQVKEHNAAGKSLCGWGK